ncbi:proline-rich protein 14 isoform X2 [Xenopus laevis]|uniref:Proline-rich protein 14 isoform X2 n=1 Tax=Xenopus laevis TaxID=8355 RepID=A0A8J0TWD4_XENLA|nr:proline-rich protein 14 isoform X2 [Xenopus laevis]
MGIQRSTEPEARESRGPVPLPPHVKEKTKTYSVQGLGMPPRRATCSEEWTLCSRLRPEGVGGHTDGSEEGAFHTPPSCFPAVPGPSTHSSQIPSLPLLLPPPSEPSSKLQSWRLVPLLHNVRSKLESFAEIFLSPVKGRRDTTAEQMEEKMVEDKALAAPQDRGEHRETRKESPKPVVDLSPRRMGLRSLCLTDNGEKQSGPSGGLECCKAHPAEPLVGHESYEAEQGLHGGHESYEVEQGPHGGHESAEAEQGPLGGHESKAEQGAHGGHECCKVGRGSEHSETTEREKILGNLLEKSAERDSGIYIEDCSKETDPPVSESSMNIQLKIAVSSAVPTLCRPPLQRCLSCPTLSPSLALLPHCSSVPRGRSHSLGTGEDSRKSCPHTLAQHNASSRPRIRRHSLGTVEEYRHWPLFPLSFSCLKKELHPFLLCHSNIGKQYHLGHLMAQHSPENSLHSEHSLHSPTRSDNGLEKIFFTSPAHSRTESQTEASLSDSELKDPESWKGTKAGKVSNFQIRKRPMRQEGNLTPMGLPKRIRLQKEEFSLEEIYTNKNYHTPTEKRTFETIFEEPVMKGGNLVLTSHRPLKRVIVFRDCTVAPRRRKRKGKGGGRGRRGAPNTQGDKVNVDLLLQHKLSQLEAELEEEMS